MHVALIHHWLVNMRGGEKVLEMLCELFPDADIFTHVVDHSNISDTFKQHRIYTTFINRLPFAKRFYPRYMPLMPLALEQLDMRHYDLVISIESGPAKGIITLPHTMHICYCNTPMRYIWGMYHDYIGQLNSVLRLLARPIAHYIRQWDYISAGRVDHFIANSDNVAKRITKYYRRDSTIIYPPVDVDKISPADKHEDFYLLAGHLTAYKSPDLAISAFNRIGKPLVVIGEGDQLKRLKSIAKSNIQFLGWQSDEVLRSYYARCKALIFPGEEDFGIVPVEAMAAGRPVIAYGKGGALETIVDETTGLFFHQPTADALIEAISRFEQNIDTFTPETIMRHAKQFDCDSFKAKILDLISKVA